MPGTSETYGGASENLITGLGEGFAVAPFCNPAMGLVTIPDELPLREEYVRPLPSPVPESTTREEHRIEVERIKSSLRGDTGKIVASRAIRFDCSVDLADTFQSLCDAYPEAFVFMFSTPQTGTWIGASPELLLSKKGQKVGTMSLAGTRPAGTEGDWDIKNREEQEMVTDFISDMLSEYCSAIAYSKEYTRKAGNVEHICTEITATLSDTALKEDTGDKESLKALEGILCRLSPTPAVCGSDREQSMRIISETERHDREMYGGFCGPCALHGETAFYVNLRSAKCRADAVCVYAGGGITRRSEPDIEWEETEIKSQTMIRNLKKL